MLSRTACPYPVMKSFADGLQVAQAQSQLCNGMTGCFEPTSIRAEKMIRLATALMSDPKLLSMLRR